MTKCGICNCHSTNENPLFCSSCVSFQLLKPKLEYIQLLNELSSSKNLVDEALDKCIKGNNYPFMTEYIQNNGSSDGEIAVNEKLSLGSIAALSSQLLTIDAILLKRKNNKIMKEISLIKSKKDSNVVRLEALKRKLNEESKCKTDNKIGSTIKSIKDQTSSSMQDSQNIKKQINNSQSILFQELINLYLIKKRKISGSSSFVFLISFIPIINIKNLISYNYEIINSSLERICKFIQQISQIWFINLPYSFQFNKSENYKPSILNFKLSLPGDNQQIWELSTFELKLFSNGISRLILNLYEVLKFFELDKELIDYMQLFNIDEMIYKIVNNNYIFMDQPSDSDDEQQQVQKKIGKIDIDELTERVYLYILNRINQKNNEWHVVKKDFLIDEE